MGFAIRVVPSTLHAMTTFVVGISGAEAEEPALDWALGAAGDADAVLALHTWEVPVVTGYESVAVVDTRALEKSAHALVEAIVAERGDPRLRGQVGTGHPGQALVDAAAAGGDAVIVVGHSGSTKVGLLLGSAANFVVHHAKGPVVVVRGDVTVPVRSIVVGVDDARDEATDSPSMQALRWALSFPGAERVEVHHAAFVPGVAAGLIAGPSMESEAEATEIDRHLQTAIAAACDGGPPPNGATVVPIVTGGTGAFALIEASRQADLVVVGTRGKGGLRQLLTGSTSLEVLAHAHCPVAVIH